MTEAPQQQHATNPQPLSRFLTVLSQNRALSFGGGSALLLLGLFIGLAYNFSQSLVFWVPFLVAGVLLFICGFGKKLPASVPLSSDPPRTSPQFPELDFPPSTKDLQQIYKDLGYLEIVLAPVEKQPEDGVPMFPQGIIGEGDLTDPRAIGAFLMGEQHGIIKRLWHTCKNYDDCVSQGRKNEAHGLRISLGVPADALPDPQTDRDFFCNELHESIMDTAAELIADRYQRLAQTESLGESSALAGAGSALAGSATQVRNDLDAHLMWDIWVHENVGKKWQKVFYWTTVRTMEPPMVATHSIQSLERFTSESNWESMAEWHSVQEDDSGGQGGGGEERQTRLPSLRAVQKDRYNPYEVDSQAAVILPWNRTADVVMGPAECGPKALDVIAPPSLASRRRVDDLNKLAKVLKIRVIPLGDGSGVSILQVQTTAQKGYVEAVGLYSRHQDKTFQPLDHEALRGVGLAPDKRRSALSTNCFNVLSSSSHPSQNMYPPSMVSNPPRFMPLLNEVIQSKMDLLANALSAQGNFALVYTPVSKQSRLFQYKMMRLRGAGKNVFIRYLRNTPGAPKEDPSQYQDIEFAENGLASLQFSEAYVATGTEDICLILYLKVGSPSYGAIAVDGVKAQAQYVDDKLQNILRSYCGFADISALRFKNDKSEGVVAVGRLENRELYLKMIAPNHAVKYNTRRLVERLRQEAVLPEGVKIVGVDRTGRERTDDYTIFITPAGRVVADVMERHPNPDVRARLELCRQLAEFTNNMVGLHIGCTDFTLQDTIIRDANQETPIGQKAPGPPAGDNPWSGAESIFTSQGEDGDDEESGESVRSALSDQMEDREGPQTRPGGDAGAKGVFVVDFGGYIAEEQLRGDRTLAIKKSGFQSPEDIDDNLAINLERYHVHLLGLLFCQVIANDPHLRTGLCSVMDRGENEYNALLKNADHTHTEAFWDKPPLSPRELEPIVPLLASMLAWMPHNRPSLEEVLASLQRLLSQTSAI